MQVKFARQFGKQYNRAPDKIKKAFDNRLDLFFANKLHPLLNNHPLTGQYRRYRSYRSINVTGDW